jgi:glycosyltransferase involved in cell wall biosynthesis
MRTETKPKILVELQPCCEGHAGIPQETRLLYSLLASLPALRVGGLVNSYLGLPQAVRRPKPSPPASPQQQAKASSRARYRQAKTLLALDQVVTEASHSQSASRNLNKSGIRRWWAERKYLLGFRDPGYLLPLDSNEFADLLWMQLFEKTLHVDQMQSVLQTDFFAASVGRRVGEYFSAWPRKEQPLVTEGWDLFLCQKGCSYRISPTTRALVRYHDAIPVFMPHTISEQKFHQKSHYNVLKTSVRSGAYFVCVSEPVRQDLLRLAPEVESRSTVIPDIVAPQFRPEPFDQLTFAEILATREFPNSTSEARNYTRSKIRRLVRQDSKNKYILVVGTLEPRKNYDLILRAFEQARRVRKSLSLVLVAHPGWRFDNEIRTINKLSEVWNVHHLWKVPIDELRFLYSGALAVVCASRNEGFDLSGVEAMLCGTPVLASDIPVHRWVYDKHALYFNPYDRDSLIRRILEIAEDGQLSSTLREAGPTYAARYRADAVSPRWEELFERLTAESRGETVYRGRLRSTPGVPSLDTSTS